MSAPLVTIFGGSGFVGRYIAQRMARVGWRVRVAVRRPNEALFVKPYGAVGQVEPVQANIRDDASTVAAIAGADVVVNCVGILHETMHQGFDAVQTEGAARIARLSAAAGVERFVHMSAIGSDAQSDSQYSRTKAEGEAAVLAFFPDAAILRSSIIFGPEDAFFNRFASMARFMPVIPIAGANTMFQPVYVDDVAAAVEHAIVQAVPGTFELGGPETATLRELLEKMLKVVRRRRVIVNMPGPIARIVASLLDFGQFGTMGLIENSVMTRDQVKLLAHDNVVSDGAKGLPDLGVTPTTMDAILESYLYCHRPYGQYTALTESAKNLRS